MGLLDISKVTSALVTLITKHAKASPVWPLPGDPDVSPMPPDQLQGSGAIGFYLYHLCENAHLKNELATSPGTPPIAHTPMALDLYYQLTTHVSEDTPEAALHAQTIMGCAVKALHDIAIIVDGTTVEGTDLLFDVGLDGAGNRFHIELLTMDHLDAVHYWTAGNVPMRLAAYYRVCVAILEPPPPVLRAGRVLRFGVTTFVTGAPRLDCTESSFAVDIPGAGPRTIALQPAEVEVGQSFLMRGTDLSGDSIGLRIESSRFDSAVEVDPMAWSLFGGSTQLSATVQATADGNDILPGTYTARAVVGKQVNDAAGVRMLHRVSNAAPFIVVPELSDPGAQATATVFNLTGGPFQHADIPTDQAHDDSCQLFVGAVRLEAVASPPGAGQFSILDASTLEVMLPSDLEPGDVAAVRVLVLGAESHPHFVEVT